MIDRATRKALKQSYRLAFPAMGIYAIRNLVTGKALIDQSLHLEGSINRHRTELRLGTHRNKALMDDWRALGEAQFVFEVLHTETEREQPDFDYRASIADQLTQWRARVPPGSAASYL